MEDTHDGHGLQRLHDLQTKFSTIETERDASVRRLQELENTEGGAVDDDAIDLLAKNVAELKMEQEKLARHIETEQEKLSNQFFKELERAHHAGAQPSTPSSRATSSRTSRSSSIILPMSPVGLPPHHLSLQLLDSPPASATSSTTGRKRIITPKRTESEAGSSTVAVEARSSSSSHNTT